MVVWSYSLWICFVSDSQTICCVSVISPDQCHRPRIDCLYRWCPSHQSKLAPSSPSMGRGSPRSSCVTIPAAVSASVYCTPCSVTSASSTAHLVADLSTHAAPPRRPINRSRALTQDATGDISVLPVCSTISVTSMRSCVRPQKHELQWQAAKTCCDKEVQAAIVSRRAASLHNWLELAMPYAS